MSQTQNVHPDFKEFDELLKNLNVWENPDLSEKATTRKYIESEVVERVFSDEGEVKFGRNVDKNSLEPKIFQSTEKVEVERKDSEELGKAYKVTAKISTLDPKDEIRIFFDGTISEAKGMDENRPILVRR